MRPQSKSAGADWTVYYLVQPYFFAHAHLHRRKIDSLRTAGFDAWVLAFVPQEVFSQHRERYLAAIATGSVDIVAVATEADIPRMAAWYFLRQILLKGRRALVHVLRIDPAWLIKLRRLPLVGNRLRLVLEFEGDQAEEFLYQSVSAYPYQELAPPALPARRAAERLVRSQAKLVKSVDGLILMSEEHVALWRQRVTALPPTTVVPSLHDPEAVGFSAKLRMACRKELKWDDKLILIYTGNVICSWQRFPALCRFVSRLHEGLPDVCLLALVRSDDLELAAKVVESEGVAGFSRILSVPAADVPGYLCAADFGLYLRHRHPMNMIVTSAKLGEYLACGLPVMTTGGNAEVLNGFIREVDGGVFLPEDLSIADDSSNEIRMLLSKSRSLDYRKGLAESFNAVFSQENDPLHNYHNFMTSLLRFPDSQQISSANERGL